ncbi:MAG: type VII toxin-antitoxin system HepT family RNase toxin [Acidimicrobiia bacterium]
MVDEGRVSRLLREVERRAQRLDRAAATSPPERSDLWLDGVKYLFVTAIEGCIDVAQHIVSSEGLGAPDTNADAIRRLGEHGVVGDDLAASLACAVGFRNVLVHGYVDVDDDVVLDSFDDVADLHRFVREVSTWLLRR